LSYSIDPISGDTMVELEECYITTRSLPCGYQVKAGEFLTEFGRINPMHSHAWLWQDQPIINTRVFGSDGMRAPGIRLSQLLQTSWYSQWYLTVQNANGPEMQSFLANPEAFAIDPVGGRPFFYRGVHHITDMLYEGRWENSWTTCCEEVTWLWGLSTALGPN